MPRSYPAVARLLIVLLVGVLVVAVRPEGASAHARLTTSEPASGTALPAMPAEIVLHFSEEVDPAYSVATLLSDTGTPVTLGVPTVSDDQRALHVPIPNAATAPFGSYTLVWRALSAADGHVTTGTVAFSAGTGIAPTATTSNDARPPWWRVLARWLLLMGLVVNAGRQVHRLLLHDEPAAGRRERRRLTTAVWLGLAAALAFSAYDLGPSATGRRLLHPPALSVYRDVLQTSSGHALLGIVLGALLLVGIERSRLIHRHAFKTLALAVSLTTLLALSATGHAAAETPEWRAVAADWVHLAAVACWLGTLPWLLLALRASARDADLATAAGASQMLARFSRLALGLMLCIVVTGFLRAAAKVSGPHTLTGTDYGIALIVKHVLLVVALVGAATNLLATRPRLQRALAAGVIADARAQLRAARTLVAIELGVAAAIVLAAAALTQLAPADGPLTVDVATRPGTFDQHAAAGDLSVWLLARIAGESNDRYALTVTDAAGKPPAALQRVIVQTSTVIGGGQVGDRFDANPLPGAPGTYVFPALRIAYHGRWSLAVSVRRAGLEDVETTFTVDTTNVGAQPPRLEEDAWRLPRIPAAAWLFGILTFGLLIAGVVAVARLRALDPFAAAIMLTMLTLIVAGFAVQGVRKTIPVTAGSALANPVADDAGSVQRGGALYQELCLQCHGAGGVGKTATTDEHGHAAGGSSLLGDRVQGQRDGDLWWSISNGIGNTEMPAFDPALTADQRWDLVNYLRTLPSLTPTATAEP